MGKDNNTIASIQHLFKIVTIQVAQHLKTHCTIMWMGHGTCQQHVRPSTYQGGDAEFVVTKQQASCLGWYHFYSLLNGKREQYNSFGSTFI